LIGRALQQSGLLATINPTLRRHTGRDFNLYQSVGQNQWKFGEKSVLRAVGWALEKRIYPFNGVVV